MEPSPRLQAVLSVVSSSLTALASAWNTVALTIDSSATHVYINYFCNYILKKSVYLIKSLNFPMTSFKIGDGYIGEMREFKFYKASVAA